MGRPKKDDQDKKQVLNIRVSFSTKNEVEAAAIREGIPVSHKAEQLIDSMLNLSDLADAQTMDLLQAIAAEIIEVQSRVGGVWHQNLKTWGAVSEMLQRGPVARWKPPSGIDDPEANKVYDEIASIKLEKQSLVRTIQILGVDVAQNVETTPQRLVSIFGKREIRGSSNRDAERESIEVLADDAAKQKARMIFEMIENADAREKEADARWNVLLRPYIETELDGRASYREYRKKEAMKQLSNGIMPSIEDLSL